MRPDLHLAMRQALVMGPDHCPPDLFNGPVAAIVSGLKAHSGTIQQARHGALQQTFPRTRRLIGAERFDRLAETYLEREAILRWPLDRLGKTFPDRLEGAARVLARIEWAWLESYGAPDAIALTLDDLAGLAADEAIAIEVAIHPAARLVFASEPAEIDFDEKIIRSSAVLVTRPDSDVRIAEADSNIVALTSLLDKTCTLGDLLERDSDATAFLLGNDALMRSGEGR